MPREIVLLALAACSFHGPLTVDGGAGDTAPVADAQPTIDGRTLTCLEKWQQHVVTLGPETPLTGVNSNAMDRDVFVTLDETQLYFSHANPDADVFLATRASTAAPFGTAVMTTLSSADSEGKFSLTEDGMIAALSATELGGPFNVVLYQRDSATSFTRLGLVGVASNNGKNNYDAYLTPDAKRLYWAPVTPNMNDQQITLASRPSTAVVFAMDHVLTELGSPASDPAPSYDETVLLYSTQADNGSIHYATRPTASGAFTPVGLVPTINTVTGNEADPHLSKDACHVYFARFSATTDWDLYVAPVL
jgi:hypothetical protein